IVGYANLELRPAGTVTAPTVDGDKKMEGWRDNNLTPYSGTFTFENVEALVDENSWSDEGEAWVSFYAVFAEEPEPEPEHDLIYVTFTNDTGTPIVGYANLELRPDGTVTAPTMDGDK